MLICPNCYSEYVEGITTCPDCKVNLVDESLIEKPEDWSEENWEVVFTSNKDYEVEMLKNNLESAGITTTILNQQDRNFPAPGDFTIIKLLVQKEDVESALDFIQNLDLESDEGEEQI